MDARVTVPSRLQRGEARRRPGTKGGRAPWQGGAERHRRRHRCRRATTSSSARILETLGHWLPLCTVASRPRPRKLPAPRARPAVAATMTKVLCSMTRSSGAPGGCAGRVWEGPPAARATTDDIGSDRCIPGTQEHRLESTGVPHLRRSSPFGTHVRPRAAGVPPEACASR